ncbi:MAG: hypothetical protein JNJ88_11700 [Planctomycetes bacterium]|nr:hypothetical protein [Planctomycetota bacterium]
MNRIEAAIFCVVSASAFAAGPWLLDERAVGLGGVLPQRMTRAYSSEPRPEPALAVDHSQQTAWFGKRTAAHWWEVRFEAPRRVQGIRAFRGFDYREDIIALDVRATPSAEFRERIRYAPKRTDSIWCEVQFPPVTLQGIRLASPYGDGTQSLQRWALFDVRVLTPDLYVRDLGGTQASLRSIPIPLGLCLVLLGCLSLIRGRQN